MLEFVLLRNQFVDENTWDATLLVQFERYEQTARWCALESKLAMLEHTVDALSGELAAHQKRLDVLQATLEALVHAAEGSAPGRTDRAARYGAAALGRVAHTGG